MTTSHGESTARAVGRLALAVVSAPIALFAFVGAAFVGVGGSVGDPGSNLAQVIFMLFLALAMPTAVIVSGIVAIRSRRAQSPSLVLAALLVAGAVALAALVGITPRVLSHSGDLASHLEAVAEQDDLTPEQLEDEVRPVFEATLNAVGGSAPDNDLHDTTCDSPSGDPGFGYDFYLEMPFDGDTAQVEHDVRAVWEEYGYVVTSGDYGVRTEGDRPIWRMYFGAGPKVAWFSLTTVCVIDPSLN